MTGNMTDCTAVSRLRDTVVEKRARARNSRGAAVENFLPIISGRMSLYIVVIIDEASIFIPEAVEPLCAVL